MAADTPCTHQKLLLTPDPECAQRPTLAVGKDHVAGDNRRGDDRRTCCPNPPDINNPACQKSMPCPNPPDRRVASCKKSQWPKCNIAAPDPQNPNCDDAKADPVTARVLKQETQGGEIVITVGAGSITEILA